MEPNEPTWDDTGFAPEDKSSGGFQPEQPAQPVEREAVQPRQSRVIAAPPKKQRSMLFWFASLMAGVLLVAVIGGGVYWLSQPTVEDEAFVAPAPPSESVTVPSVATDTSTVELGVVDTTVKPQHDDAAIAALEGTPSGKMEKETNREIEKPKPVVEQPKPKPVVEQPKPKPIVEKPKPVVEKPKQVVTKEPSTLRSPSSTLRSPSSTLRSPVGTPLYVVQVFSSPSRDDADEWLQLLRGKNVADGYITEQKIKGQSWYRVRFGQYTTKEGAESEALRLGFKEPWIARVR